MTYVYIRVESNLWTVGFYKPDGTWEPESDHCTPRTAAERVHWLNGGEDSSESDLNFSVRLYTPEAQR